MPNQSFMCWTGVLRCDAEGHKAPGGKSDGGPDWYYDDAKTIAEYKNAARKDGWKFKRDGSVICGECAKRTAGEG